MIPLNGEILKSTFSLEETDPEPPPGHLAAGVLLPLFFLAGDPHVLFTQRTMTVKDHRGQIAFPGGVRDPEDTNLLATALRESQEEIGLDPHVVAVVGSLPPVATVTGYWITAFVAVIPYPYNFQVNHREVERLLTFPLQGFCEADRWNAGDYQYKGKVIRVCCWKCDHTVVWGATARLLLRFLERLGEYPILGCGT